MNTTDAILEKMSDVFKPQRRFISVLLTTVMLMRGNVSFRNISRYSRLSEKTFSRQFGEPSDFAEFDSIGMKMIVMPQTLMIAATDCSFIPKSGKQTYGLAGFYNGIRSVSERGLEISELAVADVSCDTAYNLSVWQTPDRFAAEHMTRTDRYPEHFYKTLNACLRQSAIRQLTDIMPKRNSQTECPMPDIS